MRRHIISILTTLSIFITTAPAIVTDACGAGAVYAMTNDKDNNEVLVFNRAADGSLSFGGAFATNGAGRTIEVNDALGAQAPLILSPDNRWLFAVNAGSNEISVFQVETTGLTLAHIIASGGEFPVSLTVHGNLLYVLNAGGDGNITGFTVDRGGQLNPLSDSTRSLGAGGTRLTPSGGGVGSGSAISMCCSTISGRSLSRQRMR